MTVPTLHIVFGDSAAENLRQALRDSGREDSVACYFDNLALGPINPPNQQERLRWLQEELRCTDRGGGQAEEEAFWKAALTKDVHFVAWMARRSAPEYCGFLEWLWRLGDLPCAVVDLADKPIGNFYPAFTLGELSPDAIAANAAWNRAEVLDGVKRSHYHNLWRRLRMENAPLRVVDAGGLRSAPITFFDQQLLSFAQASWQKPSRLIAEVITEWVGSPTEPYYQAGDVLLSARIIALVELGLLEGRGDLMDIRQSQVRLISHAEV